jgi:hypothetical protein
MLHPAAALTEVPRGTRTRLIASPSGMLCTAIAIVMSRPSVDPQRPTPTFSASCTHHADDQERPPRILAPQRSQGVSVVVLEVALRHEHEADPQRKADRGARQAAIDTLPAEADARREHHTGRDRVRCPQHEPAGGADEDERQRAKPGRQRRHESSEEHCDDVRLHRGHSIAPVHGSIPGERENPPLLRS